MIVGDTFVFRDAFGRGRLNWLDPQTIRSGVEPDLEGFAGLSGARSEPSAEQVGKLIPRGTGRAGYVAELLCEAELPHCSIGEGERRPPPSGIAMLVRGGSFTMGSRWFEMTLQINPSIEGSP